MKSFVKTFVLFVAVLSAQITFAQTAEHDHNHGMTEQAAVMHKSDSSDKMMKAETVQAKGATMQDKMMKAAPTVINLSQTPGQYETTELNLAAGTYIFAVTNENVEKELGFYLTPTSDAKAQVPNSGLESLVGKGQTARTGTVTLTPGTYQYSCPLNPTPHYTITVK